MRSDVEKLKAARELIARPGGWVKGHFAVDGDNDPVCPWHANACRWCMLGALRATFAFELNAHRRLESFVRKAIGGSNIADWNDDYKRTQKEAVQAYDRAIALAEASHV